jgi:hypothetical protein
MELGRVLTPLSEFRDRMVFVRGLFHAEARKGNIHSSQTGNMLSGAPIASGGEIRSGTSFDQLLAQDLPALNESLKSKGQQPLSTPAAKVGTNEATYGSGGVAGASSALPADFRISY